MSQLISIESIRREARQAARHHRDLNAACPYPFGSDAGHAFRAEFMASRLEIELAQDDEAEQDDTPFCACDITPTREEADKGRCDACGKELVP
jgi:hypothetical protein